MARGVRHWIVDRFGLKPVYDRFLNRRVPKAPWYVGDGTTLTALFGIQLLTGIVLALTYSPAAESAHESVAYITERQVLGWFVRGLHYWSAGLMVVMLFYHLFRQILFAGYKAPREGTWFLGVTLFFCVLLMAYTGYLLRWDERAIHAIRVMLHMVSRVPFIGEALTGFVQGGSDMGPRTLTRLYGLHAIALPMLMLGLIGFHLYLVVLRGTITKGERERPVDSGEEQKRIYDEEKHSEKRGETFFPFTMFKTGAMVGVVVSLAVALTIVVGPRPVQSEADLVGPATPAEEWWFWWYSGLIALLPPSIAPWFVVIFPPLVFVFLVALPFIDRSPWRGVRQRPLWVAGVVLTAIAILALSDYRRRSAFTAWPSSEPPAVPAGIVLSENTERGRHLFAKYGCNSCHPVAGSGSLSQVGPDLALTGGELPRERIREFILDPPEDVAMPSYRERLSESELNSLVEFCLAAQTFPRKL